MLLVKTAIGRSQVHGIGLFAAEHIPQGRVVWRLDQKVDIAFSAEQVDALPEIARSTFKHYSYKSKVTGSYILCFDDARYMNHSDTPNLVSDYSDEPEGADRAARDIFEGEEMFCNYNEFDSDVECKMRNDIRS